MLKIQGLLDEVAREVESEMERERVLWSLEEMNYENMVTFYESAVDEQKRQDKKSREKQRRLEMEEAAYEEAQMSLQEQQLEELLSMVNEADSINSTRKSNNKHTAPTKTIRMHRVGEALTGDNSIGADNRPNTSQQQQQQKAKTQQAEPLMSCSYDISDSMDLTLLNCRSGDSISDAISKKQHSDSSARPTERRRVDFSRKTNEAIDRTDEEEDEEDEDDDAASNLLSFQKFLQWDFIKVSIYPAYIHLYS